MAALAPGTPAWSTGWGQLTGSRGPGKDVYSADRLRDVALPVVGDHACERVYGAGSGDLTYRPRWELCAGPGDGTVGTRPRRGGRRLTARFRIEPARPRRRR